jgi:nitrogen fixation protein FixH
MKFNWGTGIFLFYGLFAAMLVFQVIKSTQYDHSLVVEEYYAEDLAYQEKYDKIQNSMDLEEPMTFNYEEESGLLILSFPFSGEAVAGKVLFYRPSTSRLDVELPLKVDASGQMVIPTMHLPQGRWTVEVDWSAMDTEYYNEKAFDLIGDQSLVDRS